MNGGYIGVDTTSTKQLCKENREYVPPASPAARQVRKTGMHLMSNVMGFLDVGTSACAGQHQIDDDPAIFPIVK